MFTVVVLYRKALAHYSVTTRGDGWYEAVLLDYGGSSHDLPPPQIRFIREGRHCSGDTDERDLMDDLYYGVQVELEKAGGAASPGHNPKAPYVAI